MKKFVSFNIALLVVLLLCSCQNRVQKIISKYQLQNIDTLYLAVPSGYTYDIAIKKTDLGEGEKEDTFDEGGEAIPFLVTPSGETIFIPKDQNVVMKAVPDLKHIPFPPPTNNTEEGSGHIVYMDTSHIYVHYEGLDDPVDYDCDVGENVFIPCGDYILVIRCESTPNWIHCDEAPPYSQ